MANTTFAAVQAIIRETLGLDPNRILLSATPLYGAMPEFDSLAVVELALALESHFGITIDEEDFTSELFETVGTLVAYVDRRVSADEALPLAG